MAFSGIAARGSATEKVSDTGISMSPSANLTVGKLVVVTCVTDNDSTATSKGASSRHSSVTDSQGNTWHKATEYTDSDGAAADGTTISVWWCVVTTQIGTGDTITLTTAAAVTNKIISAFEATKNSASTIAVRQTGVGQSAISASVSTLPFGEYLLVGAAGSEGNDNTKTPDADYSELFDLRTGSGTAATESAMHVQTRIASLTDDTCTSTAWTNTNPIALLLAFYESFPAIETLKDNFNDNSLDGAKWGYYEGTNVTVSETNGEIEVATSNVQYNEGNIESVNKYSLVGSSVSVKMVDIGNGETTYSPIHLRIDDNNFMYVYVDSAGNLSANIIEGGVWNGVASVTYDSNVHKYVRVRESSGTVYIDYSTDGLSWSNIDSGPITFSLEALTLRITAFPEGATPSGTLVKFDNVNYLDVVNERSAEVHGATTASSVRAAEVEGVASGTATDDTRAAEAHGQDTANSARSAEVHGVATANDNRDAEVHGQASANDSRSAEVHGTATANDTRAAEVTGSLGANDSRSAEVHGQAPASASRAAEIHGTADAADSRLAEVTGQEWASDARAAEVIGEVSASDTRAAEIHGAITASSSRAAEVEGQDAPYSTRAAEVHGQETANDARSAEVTGRDNATDTRSAEVHGTADTSDMRAAEVHGEATASDSRAAELHGRSSPNTDFRMAEVHGQDTASSSRSAEIVGAHTVGDSREAEIHGSDTALSQRNAEVTGSASSTDSRSAEVTGAATASSSRAAEVYGGLTTSSSRAAEVEGVAYVPGSRYQRVNGYTTRSGLFTRRDLYTPL